MARGSTGRGLTFPVETHAGYLLCTLAPLRSRIERYLNEASKDKPTSRRVRVSKEEWFCKKLRWYATRSM